jgi:ketosteroid isomerase-like protein
MSDSIKGEIKILEDRRFQAMVDGDLDTLTNLLADDLIYTHSSGQSDTRAEYLALYEGRIQISEDQAPNRERPSLRRDGSREATWRWT